MSRFVENFYNWTHAPDADRYLPNATAMYHRMDWKVRCFKRNAHLIA